MDKRLTNYPYAGGLRAPEEPIRQIAENAGKEGSVVVEKAKQEKGAFGFNADKEEYVDVLETGIIDPTKVVRLALQNAASVTSLLITTEAGFETRPCIGVTQFH